MSNNLAVKFQALLPGDPLQIGTVISSASGSTTVEYPGGARVVVRGTAAVSSTVFVRGGAIEGPAPSLPIVTAVV